MPNRIENEMPSQPSSALPVGVPATSKRNFVMTSIVVGVVGALAAAGAIPCTFARVTHIPCPGCGSSRAVRALLHGDVAAAIRLNPFGPVMAVLLAVLAVHSLAAAAGKAESQQRREPGARPSIGVRGVRGARAFLGRPRIGSVLVRVLFVVAIFEVALWVARFFGAFGGPVPLAFD